jgi:hypothetical protein
MTRWQNTTASAASILFVVPFRAIKLNARQEILRSKSLDRDSYNNGDWRSAPVTGIARPLVLAQCAISHRQ